MNSCKDIKNSAYGITEQQVLQYAHRQINKVPCDRALCLRNNGLITNNIAQQYNVLRHVNGFNFSGIKPVEITLRIKPFDHILRDSLRHKIKIIHFPADNH